MAVPLFIHWELNGVVPVATTLNVAVCPTVTVWLAGWVVIEGATAAALTVSVAALLVTLPAVLLTMTVNCELVSERSEERRVGKECRAPRRSYPFINQGEHNGV